MFFCKWHLLLTVVGYSSSSYSTDIVYWEIPQKYSEDIEEKKRYDISQKDSQCQNIHSVLLFLFWQFLNFVCERHTQLFIYLLTFISIKHVTTAQASGWIYIQKNLINNWQHITNYSREKKITKLINIQGHKSPLENSGVTNFPTKSPKIGSMWIFLWRNTKMLCSVL